MGFGAMFEVDPVGCTGLIVSWSFSLRSMNPRAWRNLVPVSPPSTAASDTIYTNTTPSADALLTAVATKSKAKL